MEINCNYESILTIDSFVTSTYPTHGNEAKTFFKIEQTLLMKELDAHIGGSTVCVSHDKTSFKRLESVPTWFGLENTICHSL